MTAKDRVSIDAIRARVVISALLIAFCWISMSGCGSSGPPRFIVAGKLEVDSRPIEAIVLHFVPTKGPAFDAVTNARGDFTVRPRNDGIPGMPAGEYAVWVKYVPTTLKAELEFAAGKHPDQERITKLLAKYGDPTAPAYSVKITKNEPVLLISLTP